jgi:hypothetical protein
MGQIDILQHAQRKVHRKKRKSWSYVVRMADDLLARERAEERGHERRERDGYDHVGAHGENVVRCDSAAREKRQRKDVLGGGVDGAHLRVRQCGRCCARARGGGGGGAGAACVGAARGRAGAAAGGARALRGQHRGARAGRRRQQAHVGHGGGAHITAQIT